MAAPPLEAELPAGTILQHSSRETYRGTPLHFGKSKQHRYDDPAGGYGVLYLAFNLSTALMESAFHKHRWWRIGAKRKITLSEVQSRMVRIISVVADLTLCDLTSEGAAARAFGLNAAQLAMRRYSSTRALSARIATLNSTRGAPFDGIVYPSRNNPGASCVALFDCAAAKVSVLDDIRLDDHKDWPTFIRDFGVVVQPR
ncbi:MAG: RES family NAD+ phosphorylase [Thiobacillaceae bacterium]